MTLFKPEADLPQWLWLYFPPAMLPVLSLIYFIAPDTFAAIMAKDQQTGWALVEHATIIILVPGIYAGLSLLARHHQVLPGLWIKLYLLAWTLACIYFAGEEASWGQWLFQWQSPEWFIENNEQQETNLHNLSSWLNQKPRALVELWIAIAGLIVPLYYQIRKKQLVTSNWRYWFYPSQLCLTAGLCFLLVRSGKWIDIDFVQDFTASGELREYYVAVFLSIYLLSTYTRAKREDQFRTIQWQ